MFDTMRSKMGNLDERIRNMAAERAYAARRRQMGGIVEGMRGRMGAAEPDYDSVSAEIAGLMGGGPADYARTLQMKGKRGDQGRESLYQQAAAASGAGIQAKLNSMLAGTDAMSRVGQVGVYGGIGAGGGMIMTAGAQQLILLMKYLKEGEEMDSKRDQELMG